LDWSSTSAFDTGPTFALVFGYIRDGIDPDKAPRLAHRDLGGNTAGCGPAQRILPLAACHFVPTTKLAEQARLDAAITHYDSLAGDASAICVLITRLLIEGCDLSEIDHYLQTNEKPTWSAVNRANIGESGTGLDVARTAWHCLSKASNPMQEAIGISGDNNYVAPIVGAFLAAQRLGVN